MKLIGRLHQRYVFQRRVRILASHLAKLIPLNSSVLDVGCGDGSVSRWIMQRRPDIELRGVDVQERKRTFIPVDLYDGDILPYEADGFDIVMFVDMLHHTGNPVRLLREAIRVARNAILIKDHLCDGFLAGPTLHFMDWIGNAPHGVSLPYNYWTREQWKEAFNSLCLRFNYWEERIHLYPSPAAWVFGRRLHFLARVPIDSCQMAPLSVHLNQDLEVS